MNGYESFNPFPGLRSFEPDEDHLFFGREKQIDDLLRRLRKSRFLSVVGTSGSGKSSVIRSGMIPALYSGMMTRAGSSWRIAVMRPGDDPIGNLADVLNDYDVLGPEDAGLAPMNRSILETTLRASAVGLTDAVRQARIPEHDNVLVVVDQFEELFRFKQNLRVQSSRRDALTFVKLLLEAGKAAEVAVYVVITMRSDFIGNCMDFPNLPEAVNDGQYLIPRMTRDELRMAISGPAAVAGGEMSPRLVRTLLNEVGDNPDQLPILQHALMRSWNYWQDHHSDGEAVDLEHYEAIGTMKEALSRHAEEAYGELESSHEQDIAEKLFKALTDKGPHARGVRRPCRLEEVCEQVGAESAEVVAVADRFRKAGRSFIVPPDEVELDSSSVLDISHESLMRVWGRLIEWLEEEGRSAQLYRRLSRAAARYEASEGGLWGEEELALALPWREKNQPTEAWAQRYDAHFERSMDFLDASKQARDDAIAAREYRRQRRLRLARQMNWAAGIVAVMVLFFAFKMWRLSLAAETQSEIVLAQKAYAEQQQLKAEQKELEAERQRERAEELRELALDERAEAQEQRTRAEESQRIAQVQRRRALEKERQALASAEEAQHAREQAEALRVEAETQRELALREKAQADDARASAEKAQAEAQRLRRLAQFREVVFQTLQSGSRNEEVGALVSVQALRFYRQLGSQEEDPHVFDVLRHNAQRLGSKRWDVIGALRGPVRTVAVSGDGSWLAAGGDDPKARLFHLDSAAEPLSLRASKDGVRAVAFDSAGQKLASGLGDGSIRVYDLQQRKPTSRVLEGHAGAVEALAARRDSAVLASGGVDGDVRLWNLEQLTSVDVSPVGSAIRSLAFRGASPTLAVGAEDGLWLIETGEESSEPRILGEAVDVRAVAFSADGRYLAAGHAAGGIAIWDLESPDVEPTRFDARGGGVSSVSFGPAGMRLASGHEDGNARLWDVSNPDLEPLLYAHGADVSAVAFDPDGMAVVTASADRTVTLWPTQAAQLADEICSLVSRNLTRAEWHELLPEGSEYEATCPGLTSG